MPGNSLLTIDMITREAVRLFKNSNLFIMNIDTQYDPAYAVDGAKIGDNLRIRLPNDYVVTDGPALQMQSTTEQYTNLTIDNYKTVGIPFTSKERTLDIDDYAERFMAPIINNMAGEVAATVMTKAALNVCNYIANVDAAGNTGVAATGNIINPNQETFVTANAILDNNSADQMTRRAVLDPMTDARLASSMAGLLNPATEISAMFRTGMVKSGLGYERWFRDQTVVAHTAGTFSAGGTVNGGDQTGLTITVNAITGTLKKGDIITIEGVKAVNRVTKRSQERLRQFVLTADAANGATTLSIYPAITPAVDGNSQQYQTVDSSPLDGAQVVLATKASEVYMRSMAYVQKAITLGSADLVMVRGAVVECSRAKYDGISMRILTDYLTGTDQLVTRVDTIFGSLTTRPEWCCIIAGKI